MKADRIIQLVNKNEKHTWNDIVSHPLQSWEWGTFRQAMGVDTIRLGLYEKNILISGMQCTFHRIPHTPWTVGYVPKSPVPDVQMLESLIQFAKEKKAIFIQLEPNVLSINTQIQDLNDHRLVPSRRALFTKHNFILDITKPEDDLLKVMHSKTRYNIRVAQKHNVVIQEDNSPQAFEAYLQLTHETTTRQGFFAHNKTYHETMWNTLHTSGLAHLFTATYQGAIVAAWVIFSWRDTIYYPYGASSRNDRQTMAPYLLLWEIVRWAKKQNKKYFDLWGAIGPAPDVNDPWYGFHRFKQGFSPQLVEYTGSYDLIVYPLLYRMYVQADKIRWTLLKLKLRIT